METYALGRRRPPDAEAAPARLREPTGFGLGDRGGYLPHTGLSLGRGLRW